MGMYNAIVPDHLLHGLGLFKERLSQSALYAAMQRVPDDTARRALRLAAARGMRSSTARTRRRTSSSPTCSRA